MRRFLQQLLRLLLRPLLHPRRLLRRGVLFGLGGCLGLGLILCPFLGLTHPAAAQTVQEIVWQDLLPPPTEVADEGNPDPFATMPPEHLADLARAEYLRWWLENDGETKDEGRIDPEKQRQALARLEQQLADQGYDVDALLKQIALERERRIGQQDQTNSELVGQAVQLPGYALPLDPNNPKELNAFLLVPYVGACIHVPTPPPNQIVFVEAPQGVQNPGTFSPVKVTGTLRPEQRTYDLFRVDGSQPVDVAYSLVLEGIEAHRPDGASLLPPMDELGLPEGHSRWQGIQVWSSAMFGRTMTRIQEQRSPAALGLGSLLALCYGVLHTLGPGHGKAVIISYFVGQGGSLRRGLTMGVRVALFHVLSAVAVAVATDLVVRQALGSAPGSYTVVRLVSYGAIAAIGFWMLHQATDSQPEMQGGLQATAQNPATNLGTNPATNKGTDSVSSPLPSASLSGGSLSLSPNLSDAILSGNQTPQLGQQLQHQSQGICGCIGCGDGKGGWLSLAIGAVPCSGALLVLLYGLANDLLWASLVMVLAISLGMAVTLSAIGIFALWGREQASKRMGSDRKRQQRFQSLRVLSACAVLVTGTFLFGLTLASAVL